MTPNGSLAMPPPPDVEKLSAIVTFASVAQPPEYTQPPPLPSFELIVLFPNSCGEETKKIDRRVVRQWIPAQETSVRLQNSNDLVECQIQIGVMKQVSRVNNIKGLVVKEVAVGINLLR